ncbi:MAG: transporter substrate-binding protein [Paenibacillus sp.]|jgi:multiple sugar transport system substrate-binding protein|nr:transporter substrate-binding protein [Paenibacillus sp.]
MKTGWKKVKLSVALMSVAISMTACGGEGKGGGDAGVSEPSITTSTDVQKIVSTPTTLAIAYRGSGGTDELFNSRFGDAIRKKFPNYTIEYVPVVSGETPIYASRMFSKTEPFDIVIETLVLTPQNVVDLGIARDISDLIKKYQFDLTQIEPMQIDMQRKLAKGGIYGLPWTTEQIVFVYNKDLFDKFGVAYPRDGLTWDDTYELARKLTRTENGQAYMGIQIDISNFAPYNQLSAPLIDAKTLNSRVTEDPMKRLIENWARFYKIPGNHNASGKYVYSLDALFKDQNVAMFIGTSGIIKRAADSGMNWDVAAMPVFPDKPGVGSQPMPNYVYITNKSSHPDAAFQVVAYLASAEYQEWYARTAAFLPALKNNAPIMKQFGAELKNFEGKKVASIIPPKYADLVEPTAYTPVAQKHLINAVNAYLSGTDMNTALRQASDSIDKEVADMQK